MKKSKKLLALLLCLAMVFGLAACGNSNKPANSQTPAPGTNTEIPAPETETPGETEADPDAIEDSMTSADSKYQVAFVTDVGQLKDKSFNQGTFDGVKLYAAANGLSYKYYQPANGSEATDDDRYDAMKAAVEGGADVVVCAGYLQEAALKKAAIEYPETPFVFIDGYPLTDDAGNTLSNVAGIAFKEEQAGYLAGYAAVMDGFTKLGFSGGGGGTNPACCRFGYGYVQGANAAALEKGVTVDMNYSWQYGSNFSASTDLQTMINGWYVNGTEIVFACGGSMFASVAAAAGGFMGVSSITTFVESTSGAADGGRTGLTSVTTGVLFILAAFFSPIVTIVSSAATCGALVYVGYLMMSEASEIDWSDVSQGFPAFMIVAGVPFT